MTYEIKKLSKEHEIFLKKRAGIEVERWPDGSVSVEVDEGPGGYLDSFVEWCDENGIEAECKY